MASKSTKGEILAKFFDDGEYTALFADGAASQHNGRRSRSGLLSFARLMCFGASTTPIPHGVSL